MYSFIKYNFFKSFLFYFGLINVIFANAQLSSLNNYISLKGKGGVDKVLIFDKIDNNTQIKYKGSTTSVKWYDYKNGVSNEQSNLKYIYPENNKGYILEADGKRQTFWVFDYSQYKIELSALTISANKKNPCQSVDVLIKGTVPVFQYQNLKNDRYVLERKVKLTYPTLVWKEQEWQEKDTTQTIVLKTTPITVDMPLQSPATFMLVADELAEKLNIKTQTITSDSFVGSALKAKILTSTTTRDALNENNRPSQKKQLEGSAPLEVLFTAKSTPNAESYTWKIFKDKELFLTRNVKEHRYTFVEAGNYKVKLEVSNEQCIDSASVDISVSESQIFAPNVFTPNGDGKNDEFRVAYQSIVEFEGTIVNSWGRTVFSWKNPAQGWNGKINGKEAAEGTYFYIINAKGSDGKRYKLKGHLNLLR